MPVRLTDAHENSSQYQRAKLPKELEKTFGGRASGARSIPFSYLTTLALSCSSSARRPTWREDLGDEGNELEITEQLDAKAITESKLFQELKVHHKNHPAQALFWTVGLNAYWRTSA